MQLSTYSLLVIAYLIVWMAIFFYVARLHFEQQRLGRELKKLQSQLPDANSDAVENGIIATANRCASSERS